MPGKHLLFLKATSLVLAINQISAFTAVLLHICAFVRFISCQLFHVTICLRQLAVNFLNDMWETTLSLRHPANFLAAGALYCAIKITKTDVPLQEGGKPWCASPCHAASAQHCQCSAAGHASRSAEQRQVFGLAAVQDAVLLSISGNSSGCRCAGMSWQLGSRSSRWRCLMQS